MQIFMQKIKSNSKKSSINGRKKIQKKLQNRKNLNLKKLQKVKDLKLKKMDLNQKERSPRTLRNKIRERNMWIVTKMIGQNRAPSIEVKARQKRNKRERTNREREKKKQIWFSCSTL